LDSPNPKLWPIALIVAEILEIEPIAQKVRACRGNWPEDGVAWLDLLETILVYKLPAFTREEIQQMFGLDDVDFGPSWILTLSPGDAGHLALEETSMTCGSPRRAQLGDSRIAPNARLDHAAQYATLLRPTSAPYRVNRQVKAERSAAFACPG
jgi:hypothetical protein